MTFAVFAGPSLPRADRIERDDVTYLPPAARYDVLAAARAHDAVLLIDGVFHHDLAPSAKECFAALAEARMFGAASMGALRAVECAPYGFTPLGAIARWYACERVDGDDEVAVATDPVTHEALSVPLVNVRYVAWLALRRGMLSPAAHDTFVAAAREIFYADRTWDELLERAPRAARNGLRAIVASGADLKRIDARFALRTALRVISRPHLERRAAPTSASFSIANASTVDSSPIVIPEAEAKARETYDRAVPVAKTLAMLPELRRRYGITRVADTTYLDRTGIPTYSAFVPYSPDLLGVYNGKGLSREAAIVSAVMEAAERQIAARVTLPVFRERVDTVSQRIDLRALGLRNDTPNETIECVLGTELLGGETLPVPLALVQCPWFGEKRFDVTSTNGLASGNTVTEALYHALCEVIERHVWAMFHVRCSLAPKFFLGPNAADVALAPEVRLPCGDPAIDALFERIQHAGCSTRVLALCEESLPFTALATITEGGTSPPMAHMGLGCSLSPAHAVVRALTEAAQSRAVDIQAAREDLLRHDEAPGMMGAHARRLQSLPTRQWYYDLPAPVVQLCDYEERASDDLAADLQLVLDALRRFGAVIAVHLSPPDLEISVVRAIVPGLETLMIDGRIGQKARALLNPYAIV